MDLIAFLKSVFESFTNLPSRLAGMACMSSCQHLARSIMNIIMDEGVKAVSQHIYCLSIVMISELSIHKQRHTNINF